MVKKTDGYSNPVTRYHAKMLVKKTIAFNKKTDADILDKFDGISNLSGYLKALVRADMENGNKVADQYK